MVFFCGVIDLCRPSRNTSGIGPSEPLVLNCLFFPSRQNIPEDRRVNKEDDGEEEKEEEDEGRSDEGFMGMTPLLQAHHAMEKVEEFVHKVTSSGFCSSLFLGARLRVCANSGNPARVFFLAHQLQYLSFIIVYGCRRRPILAVPAAREAKLLECGVRRADSSGFV